MVMVVQILISMIDDDDDDDADDSFDSSNDEAIIERLKVLILLGLNDIFLGADQDEENEFHLASTI